MVAGDLAGLHNAIVTLVQLFRLFFNQQPDPDDDDEMAAVVPVQISDFPDSPLRATLLDLNPYGRMPKMVNTSSISIGDNPHHFKGNSNSPPQKF